MARVPVSRSPFDVTLVSSRPAPAGNGTRRFVFDVHARRAVQRYEVDAKSYEDAREALNEAVAWNVTNSNGDVDNRRSNYYSENDSSRVASGVVALIVAGTIVTQWVIGALLRWGASEDQP